MAKMTTRTLVVLVLVAVGCHAREPCKEYTINLDL